MSDKNQVELWDAVRTVNRLKRQVKITGYPEESDSASPLITIQSGSSPKPLFMVPGIVREGEETTKLFLGFARIARYLDKEQPFYALKPWILEGEQKWNTVEAIAAHYIKSIQTFHPCKPYFLGGECVGGIVAFEMAQQLVTQGHKVALLALLDTRRPTDTKTLLNYKPQPYSGRIVLLATSERLCQNPALGWNDVATGGLETYTIPGKHRTYIREHAQVIGERLKVCLDGNINLFSFNEHKETFVAPRDELELQLVKIWEKVLDQKPISIRYNFFDLGGNSLLAVNLFAQIEKKIGIDLPLATLFKAATVADIANMIRQKEWLAPWSSLVAIQPNGVKQPFFGVHTNDGSVLFYRHLIPHLNPEQPFYGLQAPVQDGKQIPFTRIEDKAAHYIKEIRTLQPSGPYLLGGFCIGGVIAFEMAQQLVAQGEQVALLALFDAFAPFPLSLRSRISLHFGYFLHLEPQEKLTYLLTRLGRRIKLLAKTIQKIPAKFYRNIQRLYPGVNTQKASPYTPQIYPGLITLFRASKQLPITYHLPDLGWGKLASEGVEVHNIPGAHTDIVLNEPSVSILAQELQACIDKATTEEKPESHSSEPKNSTTKISRQASLLKQEEWSPSWSSLVPIQPSGSKPPLFWCHAGGGGVLHYRELTHRFGWEQPVYGLQAQGLDGKQTPLTRIEDMVAHYIKEIQTLQPSGPYFLGGFCFGGILAFEMAQQLVAQGQQVALLALIETPCRRQLQSPPIGLRIKLHLKNFIDSEPRQKLSYIQQQVKGKSKWLGNRFKKWKNRTWLRSVSTFYRSWGHSLPYDLRTEVLEEANKQAMRGYIPQVYPGKITLFLSEKVALNLSHKSRLGWDSLAAGGLEIHQVPGQHSTIGAESMVQEPHVRTLAEKLKSCIDKAIAEVVQEQADLGS